ncbi:MAG: rod shape-determining protein MreC [Candidatus Improbicoccus pseudotrichonymphae]|uniref:Cell shape-determining protein MreC n=1 Tax=Candidatus Improbicoccus pseudotrichonymphae TaxID=3033792 RepID=A0AA48HV48_9FIRM|nr:MAG: rod shape-determining protein MreC [Candidatus Improbicoccus pseudotrichonymphae]
MKIHDIIIKNYVINKFIILVLSITMIISGFFIFFQTYQMNALINFSEKPFAFFVNLISNIDDSLKDLINEIKTSRNSVKEIEELKNELNRLRDVVVNYHNIKEENVRLLKFHEIKKNHPQTKLVYANVTGRLPLNKYRNFVIDIGANNGISVGDPVISEEGFIGVILRSGNSFSIVRTIFSHKINIGAKSLETGNLGVISGNQNLLDKSLLKLSYLRLKESVQIGNTIITSGLGGKYPKDFKIGEVEFVGYDNKETSYYAIVKPFANIRETQNVYVITDFINKNIINLD